MKSFLFLPALLFATQVSAQQTPFEKSKGKETATYFEAINFYMDLAKKSSKIFIKKGERTDAGYPLHLVLISNDKKFDPTIWHRQNKVVILINNGIHPGEPDGIDASMMLARDIAINKIQLPDNVAIGIIPVYNIGGCLNRNSYSRANQNGPVSYGFRGNSENLDLNRDFTKCDTKDAKAFTEIFHYMDPEIQVDTHVSDGADYQHTMTLITTQYDKLGATLGSWVKTQFEPGIYSNMAEKKWEMIPYVNFETSVPDKGMEQFYDPPRYSSGYAALFQTISFMPETHMLKPFKDRVLSTYALLQTMIEQAGLKGRELVATRKKARKELKEQVTFPLSWKLDSSKFSLITFKGYEQGFKTSDATGLQRMYYDRTQPFTKQIKYFDVYNPVNPVSRPKYYIIPIGWKSVIDLLQINKVQMSQLQKDSIISVEAYHIDDYKSFPKSYEKHHKNYDVKVSSKMIYQIPYR